MYFKISGYDTLYGRTPNYFKIFFDDFEMSTDGHMNFHQEAPTLLAN
jgi:hypothetical protein